MNKKMIFKDSQSKNYKASLNKKNWNKSLLRGKQKFLILKKNLIVGCYFKQCMLSIDYKFY